MIDINTDAMDGDATDLIYDNPINMINNVCIFSF